MRKQRKFTGAATLLTVASLFITLVAGPVSAGSASRDTSVPVIVMAGSVEAANHAVLRHGGLVEGELPLIGAVSARVQPESVAAIERSTGVAVTPDETITLSADDFAGTQSRSVQLEALNVGPGWAPNAGAGVGVALIDTGVAQTADLSGRVVLGPDLSGEADGTDRYGHGTFMAGLIAGDGSASTDETVHYGTAPGAHIVSVKVAGRDGATSLSKVLEGIGWAVNNRKHHSIGVLSLSLGVVTPRSPQADPLSAAVEAAWASGLVVVAASGNEGSGTVTSPGRDPWVITVGASDTNGTVTTTDDTVPAWSGSGKVTSVRKPELLAPGNSVVSLRAPGSLVDETYPEARVGDAYFRGSGTSMAAASAAGAAAILLQHHPEATPDDVKGALIAAGDPMKGTTAKAIDISGADAAHANPDWLQRHPVAAKGLGGQLKGNEMPWAGFRWAGDTWRPVRWVDGEWVGFRWADEQWAGFRWADERWAGFRWADEQWVGFRWADEQWAGFRWADERWAGFRWAQAMWGDDQIP